MSSRSHVFDPAQFRRGVRHMLLPAVALIPFGLVCGVAANALGLSMATAFGLSAIVFSGAAQILAMELYAAGAPLSVIVPACIVIGLRLLMYSAALAPYFASLPPRWRGGLGYLLTDQSFAQTIRHFEPGMRQGAAASYFLGCGCVLWTGWQLTNLAGFVAGNVIPAAWSLDFAVPLCFVAIVAPLFRERTMQVAGLAAAVAVIALGGLPMRLNVVLAGLIGIVAGTLAESILARRSR
jgi:predicted branched-subunit amino acid permease